MRPRDCERTWEGDALREGRLGSKEADSFERHRRTCSACAASLVRDERLRALGRQLPEVQPAPLAVRRVRARLLRDATVGVEAARFRSWRWLAATAAVLGVLGVGAGVRWSLGRSMPAAAVVASAAPSTQGPFSGAVAAGRGAVWSQTREEYLEHVELREGMIRVHVRPQGPGERFLIVMPDGELEVRGTTFEVAVAHGATSSVIVDEGTVELRVRGSSPQRLGAGSAWTRAPSREAPEHQPAETPALPREAARAPVEAARASTSVGAHLDDSAAYVDAMQLFRDGRYDGAAATFRAFAAAHPGAAVGEDASFLEAVALARAGRTDAAGFAAERHLESFPRSFRRKEASLLVARAASRRGDCERARAVLAPWSASGNDSEIHESLRACAAGSSGE